MFLAFILIFFIISSLIGENEEEDIDMKEDAGIKFMNLFLEEGKRSFY